MNNVNDLPAGVGHYFYFMMRSVLGMPGCLLRPGNVLRQFHAVFAGALPLAAIMGIALGIVIWIHTSAALERTPGAIRHLPTILSVSVLLELAPIGAGLIVAARTGAFLGAELGAMRIGEQIDALELLGVGPMQRLVAPRVLACMLSLPLLHILIASLAIGAGFCLDYVWRGTTWLAYEQAFLTGPDSRLYLAEVVPAMLKTIVFGFLIGVTGCFFGLNATGGTEGVGKAATQGVVTSAMLVIVSNVFLVALIHLINR